MYGEPSVHRHETGDRTLAVGLAALAGYVDALGFLKLGGLFVSFMSGNSTRLAVGLTKGSPVAATAAALILSFAAGVVVGSVVGRASGSWRKPGVLAAVVALLSLAAIAGSLSAFTLATLLMASSMGAANGVFQREGEVTIGVTYMTGTLVKFAQHLEGSFHGGARLTWVPYLILWCGLVTGAIAGAAAYSSLDLGALWLAAGYGVLLTVGATLLRPTRGPGKLDRPEETSPC